MAPTAYLPGRLLMPQATERARNDRDEQIATMDSQLRLTLSRFCSIAWLGAPRPGLDLASTSYFPNEIPKARLRRS